MSKRSQLNVVNRTKIKTPIAFSEKAFADLRNWLQKSPALSRSQKKHLGQELTLVFLPKKAAQELNFKYRGRNYATDVLSFSFLDESSLGELVFSPDVIEVQAKENHHSFEAELCYLLIHGVLHLLGFDHEGEGVRTELDSARMMKIQDELFDRFRKKYDF